MLRRDLLRLRNAAAPLVEVCRRLTNAELPQIRAAMHPLFRDVTDHMRTVQEKIDNLREVLAFAFEASVLMGQSQETAISKKLAVLGGDPRGADGARRHLRHELQRHAGAQLPYGYPIVIAGMLVICRSSTGASARNGSTMLCAAKRQVIDFAALLFSQSFNDIVTLGDGLRWRSDWRLPRRHEPAHAAHFLISDRNRVRL